MKNKSEAEPCGRCDFCIDGKACPNEELVSAAELSERLEQAKLQLAEAEVQIFNWQCSLHEILPGFHWEANIPTELAPRDIQKVFGIMLEEQNRISALILTQERRGPSGCPWCNQPGTHHERCPMFESEGYIRFGEPPLASK